MLIIRRRAGESLVLAGTDGEHSSIVTVLSVQQGRAVLGVTAPFCARAEVTQAGLLTEEALLHLRSVRDERMEST